MQIRALSILAIGAGFACLMLVESEAIAQKKKKKKGRKEHVELVEVQATASAEEKRKAEMYHTEAEKYYMLDDYAKAFVLYQKSLELDPQNATAFYKIAHIFLKSDDIEKAKYNAQQAIKLDDENKYFYLLLAEIYTKKSDFALAATTYETMIEKCNKTNEYLFELAALYIYQENYAAALDIYSRIEHEFGLNEQITAQKQKLYLKQSNLDMAIEEGQKLIDAFPGEPRYVLMMVDILLSNNKADKAVPILEDLLVEDPDNARALLLLADIYRKNGDDEKSNIYLTKAFEKPELEIQPKIQVLSTFMQQLPNADLEILAKSLGKKIILAHPEDFRAYEINGDLAMKLSADSAAIENYRKSLELGSSNYNTWQSVLQLDVKMERYQDAIKDGEQALELFPNQAGICWFLGTAYLVQKDYEAAVEVLERGKKLSGVNGELKSLFNAQLGDTYNNLGKYKNSDNCYEAALAYDPDNDHVLNNYSYFLSLRKEKLDMAKKMSAKLVARNPEDATYLDTHAWVLYVSGEFEEAKLYIEKAVNSNDDLSGTIIEHYGDILFKLGDVDSAVKQWQKAKGMDETSELIDKKIADRKLYEK
jgi:tetratricopeptide (TPR) repeat protein